MRKIDELKISLIVFKRTRDISKAVDICDWLVKELGIGGKGFGDATPSKPKIGGKK